MDYPDDIRRILEDRESGSITLLNRLVASLDHSLRQPGFSRESFKKLLTAIRKELRHFAAIENFLAPLIHLMNRKPAAAEDAMAYIADYRDYWADSTVRIAENFLRNCHPEGQTILTHSHSQTIISLLEQLQLREIPFRILQTLSAPGEEGKIACERMRHMKVQAELIDDAFIPEALTRTDLVIMGCDTLLATEFLNKSGTLAILEQAWSLNIPSCLLGESRKEISVPDWKKQLPEQSLFEWVPLDLVDRMVTDKGD